MNWFIVKKRNDIWDKAYHKALNMPIYDGSHRGSDANMVGALGETIVEYFLEENNIKFNAAYDTKKDLIIKDRKFEVKTKDRTVRPKPNYDCSIPCYNHAHQQPDFYIFVSLYRNKQSKDVSINKFEEAYILGGCSLNFLDKNAKLWKKGETDPSNGTKFWTDCLNIYIKDLTSIHEIFSF